jgi:polyhydroxyalkanoate synthesis regulator phasin
MMDELKKLVFAGIGGAALSYEKAQEIIESLEKKGKLSVDEGKRLKEELMQRKNNGDNELSNREELEVQLIEMASKHRTDIDELERKVTDLTQKVEALSNK